MTESLQSRRAIRSAPSRRPLVQLAGLADAAPSRVAAVATAGGILASTLVGAMPAVPASVDTSTETLDLQALKAQAREALAAAQAVSAPVDAQVLIDGVSVAGLAQVSATPAPEAVVAPTPEPERAAARSGERAPIVEAPVVEAPAVEAPAPAPAPVPPSAIGSAVIEVAARYVGVPYVYGGTSPAGFDCSGLVQYVYGQLGIGLPRTDVEQRYSGVVVPASEAQPGDLVWTPGHVAIYAGGGMIIDAPRPGATVQFRAMYQSNPTFVRIG